MSIKKIFFQKFHILFRQGPIDQQKTDRMPTPATLTQSNAQPAAIDTPFQRLPHPFMTSPMRGTAGRFPIPPVHLLMNAAGGNKL